ncbi:transcriptional regulator [Rhodophyticola sp. CCM32]|uniref:ChrR family anti-sigma-E factor n=1 Tax=Rhodophyticola sp. CCM32 TaxID=2916397 RepID=UPI00107F7B1F|nr:ChrR family anti-sigma-E factor [Rhodophyticola sp. CCM32]QBY02417.1 transcriptional regulator [Rhodophyticola sp. CCM32]
MIDVNHQIPDDLLMGYAAGALPEAFDLVVATHVSLSDEARARLESYEAIGGGVLETIGLADLDAHSLEATLARITGDPMPEMTEIAPATGVFPAPLRQMVGGDLDTVKWRPVGMGVKQCVLHTGKDASARLLYIPAGQAMPMHSHRGTEMTLVLQGAYADEEDRFARGDIEIANAETHHTPTAEPGADCICLIATDAPLKFDGILPRIAQPFVGI